MVNEIRSRIRRSRDTERDTGKWLQKHDGIDEKWKGISSSTSRVGHITQLQFDVVSPHYACEVKNVKLPATMLKWWLQIVGIAATHGKDALLVIRPSNVVEIHGVPKRPMNMHIITEERHAELLRKEKEYDATHYGEV
jgi:hypothetical protein